MKKILDRRSLAWAATLLASTTALSSQDLQAKKVAALDREFLARAGWLSDFGRAKEQAAATGQLIFAYFSRSYAP